jgi:hypothetical protein
MDIHTHVELEKMRLKVEEALLNKEALMIAGVATGISIAVFCLFRWRRNKQIPKPEYVDKGGKDV